MDSPRAARMKGSRKQGGTFKAGGYCPQLAGTATTSIMLQQQTATDKVSAKQMIREGSLQHPI